MRKYDELIEKANEFLKAIESGNGFKAEMSATKDALAECDALGGIPLTHEDLAKYGFEQDCVVYKAGNATVRESGGVITTDEGKMLKSVLDLQKYLYFSGC